MKRMATKRKAIPLQKNCEVNMIRPLNLDEIPSALQLTWEVFEAPDYSDEGVKTFRDFINDETQIVVLTFYGAFCESLQNPPLIFCLKLKTIPT